MQKIDPYLNVDAGTMNPFQHGEVFVLDDGSDPVTIGREGQRHDQFAERPRPRRVIHRHDAAPGVKAVACRRRAIAEEGDINARRLDSTLGRHRPVRIL